jgi:hypothetical protein
VAYLEVPHQSTASGGRHVDLFHDFKRSKTVSENGRLTFVRIVVVGCHEGIGAALRKVRVKSLDLAGYKAMVRR